MANPKMWLKRVLIPLWTIQLIVLAVFFVLACIVLSYASATSDSSYYYDYSDAYAAAGGVVLALSGFCIVLTLVEVGLLAARRLGPIFQLISACIKTLIWIIWFLLNCVASAGVGSSSALDIVLSLIIALCAIGQVIYGGIIMHRVRRGFFSMQGSASELQQYSSKVAVAQGV
ncbi:hypothetical protein WHR41_09064 [Cladosporium halotolerans]|uniref:MARVEL domain-containing protein n=1 Tax=Cladosporium halotolerans TaxID=1052096 RepID=A0AB34KBG9_9PEZI